LPSGLDWNVVYSNFAVLLEVVAPTLLGDFNEDGAVDAADYVVWRRSGGSQDGYNAWRANFGRSNGSGSAGASPSLAALPEPATFILLIAALGGLTLVPRSRGHAS
jgi:hypothetical protein